MYGNPCDPSLPPVRPDSDPNFVHLPPADIAAELRKAGFSEAQIATALEERDRLFGRGDA